MEFYLKYVGLLMYKSYSLFLAADLSFVRLEYRLIKHTKL